ncbi:MAG: hypothetical protein AB1705_08520 [Verrucomicrobiota bacterium]
MPLYEYVDTRTGNTVELIKPVAQRDQVPSHLRRVTVPRRLHVTFGAPWEMDVDVQMPKGLRQMEERIGVGRMERESGFTAKQLKQIWAEDQRRPITSKTRDRDV